MKKLIILIAAILLTLSAAYADNVANTKHNLTNSGNPYYTTSIDEICVPCHTPHGGNLLAPPLWNRDYTSGPFTMYESTTRDMPIAGAPEPPSLMCLSCHDGTISMDMYIRNEPGSGYDTIDTWTWGANGNTMTGTSVVGTNLSNDHPVSIFYDPAYDSNFKPIVNNEVNGLPLFGTNADQLECATCHNVHNDNPSERPLLRFSNAGSALCLRCHVK